MFLASSGSYSKYKVLHMLYQMLYIGTIFHCLSFDKQLFSTYSLSIGQFSFFLFIVGIRFVFKLAMKRNDIFRPLPTYFVGKKIGLSDYVLAYTSNTIYNIMPAICLCIVGVFCFVFTKGKFESICHRDLFLFSGIDFV